MDSIKIVIELNRENGSVNVSGPLKDRILTLGLIEEAKRFITQLYSLENEPPKISDQQPKILIPKIHP